MPPLNFLDFDLEIEPSDTGYRVEVNSPAGQASHDFVLPFSDLELENFVLRMGRPYGGTRRIDSQDVAIAKAFGSRLFDAVFDSDARSCLRSSSDEATAKGQGLRLRLRLNRAPELADVPWEYLYNPTLNRFLALSTKTPLVRYLELPERIRPIAVTPPLKILAVIANPKEQAPLAVEHEWRQLRDALGDLVQRGLVTIDRLEKPTLEALRHKFRRDAYHVLHFIGHGGFDPRLDDGVLLFEDDDGYSHRVNGQSLGMIIYDHDSLRLAVLNACEGGRASRDDPFAGVAQSLVQQGTPAVIAMQFEVSDEAATTLSHEFYAMLAEDYPVDAALAEARRALYSRGNSLEWGTPVLYMRAPDGRIFDVAQPMAISPQAEVAAADVASLKRVWQQALTAFYTQEWDQAVMLLTRVANIDAAYEDVQSKLDEARKQQQAQRFYTHIRKLREADKWHEALTALEALRQEYPDFQDTAGLRRWAEGRQRYDQQFAKALEAFERKDWEAAITILEPLHSGQPGNAEVQTLLSRARAEQRAATGAGLSLAVRRHGRAIVIAGVGLLLISVILLAIRRSPSSSGSVVTPTSANSSTSFTPSAKPIETDTATLTTPATTALGAVAPATIITPATTALGAAAPATAATVLATPVLADEGTATSAATRPPDKLTDVVFVATPLPGDPNFRDFSTQGTPPIIGRVLTVDEWRDYVARYNFRDMPPTRIVLKHTFSPTLEQWQGQKSLLGIQEFDASKGYTAGAHIYAGPDGIWLFTPMSQVGIHSAAGNSGDSNGQHWYSIGIVMIGYYDRERPSGAVWENTKSVIGALSQRLQIPPENLVTFHRDYSKSTSSPGWAVTKDWVIDEVKQWMEANPLPATTP
jgi:hypothetical protein